MSNRTAIKVQVVIGSDRTIKLPDDVPLGPAEVIVLVHKAQKSRRSLLGLFADEPEAMDEAMAYVRERRRFVLERARPCDPSRRS